MTTEKKDAPKEGEVTKVGPPVDERHDDGRKDDHGDLGPRPQGAKHGDGEEVELAARATFLQDVHAKLVERAEQDDKPRGKTGAQTK